MTAQPLNRFVFCVVVVEFAVNGNQALRKPGLMISKYLFATTKKDTIKEYKKTTLQKAIYASKSFTIKIQWQG